MAELGHVKDIGFDANGREQRERLDAIAECPECGQEVECWASTEAWTQDRSGRWVHTEYGGAVGFCEACHLVIADCLSGGYRVFKVENKS